MPHGRSVRGVRTSRARNVLAAALVAAVAAAGCADVAAPAATVVALAPLTGAVVGDGHEGESGALAPDPGRAEAAPPEGTTPDATFTPAVAVSGAMTAAATTTVAVPTTLAPVTTTTAAATTTAAPPPVTTVPVVPPPSGFFTFRGDATRRLGGVGPVPTAPRVLWRAPGQAMCHPSTEYGKTTTWCGTGWVGQPVAVERDGRTLVMFGAYDGAIHVLDAATGADALAPVMTGDIAKGTVTADPDGFPLLYAGSRDNLLRVIALDRPVPQVLFTIDALRQGEAHWNDDWDGAPLIVRDHLVAGGENGRLHVVKLNRSYGPDGRVRVEPGTVWSAPGWDRELLRVLGDDRVSIEGSVAMSGTTVWCANSGGLVQGWDIGPLLDGTGEPVRTFRFWTGDDTDAAVVVGESGELYVGVEWDRGTARAREVGQFLRLDPTRPDDPVVWSVHDAAATDGGTWSTAALWQDLVIWPTGRGRALGLDRATGAVRWQVPIGYKTLSSAVVVDGVWVQGDSAGRLRAYDVRDTMAAPRVLWEVRLPSLIESTPLVYRGRIYVGTRDGFFYAVGDA